MTFQCAKCNAQVFQAALGFDKPCGHSDEPVLANMEATVTGTSSVK